ncbi:MAG: hypothetical protein WBG92_01040 [Thiohalocapsa sp.]
MQPKDLADTVQRLFTTRQPQQLDEEQLQQLHADFRRHVAPVIDEHRESQRRAYEETRDITLR